MRRGSTIISPSKQIKSPVRYRRGTVKPNDKASQLFLEEIKRADKNYFDFLSLENQDISHNKDLIKSKFFS